jgi:integrase/recombinase XerD
MNTIEIELKKYESYLRLSNFSIRCVRSYVSTLKYFLEYCKKHYNEKSIDQQMVSEYLLMRLNKGLSWSAINCDYSSLRKYFKNVADIEWDLKKLPRPRKEKILPTIFSQEQVQKIIESANTYKQQIFITFLYGTGMRLSEGINVKFEDIDADRLQIKVNKGKGGKDRMVQVPIELVQLLREYYLLVKPEKYLFNGIRKGHPYSPRAAQHALKIAKSNCKVMQKGSIHTIRHCYATHHLELGTDLVFLQEQLGHKNLKTTAKYIHLCVERYRNIIHPLTKMHLTFKKRIV